MPISTVCVWVWMQPGGAEGEPFARCNLKQFRALSSLCVWRDRSGWTVIRLLLFLVLFFLYFTGILRLVRCDNSYTLLSVSALAPFFLKWRERARTGWFERVEERSVMVLTSPPPCPPPLPYSHSPSLLLSCLIPRVWPPVRLECLMEGGHTCGCSFTHAPLHIQVHMHRHYIDSCAVPSAHWLCSTHRWNNCCMCTDTHRVTLSLVEPLNGGPLTATQSQSLLAENR